MGFQILFCVDAHGKKQKGKSPSKNPFHRAKEHIKTIMVSGGNTKTKADKREAMVLESWSDTEDLDPTCVLSGNLVASARSKSIARDGCEVQSASTVSRTADELSPSSRDSLQLRQTRSLQIVPDVVERTADHIRISRVPSEGISYNSFDVSGTPPVYEDVFATQQRLRGQRNVNCSYETKTNGYETLNGGRRRGSASSANVSYASSLQESILNHLESPCSCSHASVAASTSTMKRPSLPTQISLTSTNYQPSTSTR